MIGGMSGQGQTELRRTQCEQMSSGLPQWDAPGNASLKSAKRFALSSTAICVNPVMLPGCARLPTNFVPIGSGTTMNTVGMIVVARCAAIAAGRVTATSDAWRNLSSKRGAFPIFAYTPQGLGPARLNAPALPGHGAAPLYATWGRWGRDAYRRDRQADAHL